MKAQMCGPVFCHPTGDMGKQDASRILNMGTRRVSGNRARWRLTGGSWGTLLVLWVPVTETRPACRLRPGLLNQGQAALPCTSSGGRCTLSQPG